MNQPDESQPDAGQDPPPLKAVRYRTDPDLARDCALGWVFTLCAQAVLARMIVGSPSEVAGQYSWFFLNVALLGAIRIPTLLLHEIGHLVVARLAGLRIYGFVLGVGAILFRAHWGRLRLAVHTFPLAGAVEWALVSERCARTRLAAATLGGIAFNFLAMATVVALEGPGVFTPAYWQVIYLEPAPIALFGLANFLLLVWSAIPLEDGAAEGPTDGFMLLRIKNTDTDGVQDWLVHGQVREVSHHCHQGREAGLEKVVEALKLYPTSLQLRCQQASLLLSTGRYRESLAILLPLYEDASLDPQIRGKVLALLSYAATMDEGQDLRPNLRAWTGELFSTCAGDPWIKALRGRAIFASGRTATGLAMMRVALGTSWIQPDERADIACWLAISEAESGRLEEARRLVKLARGDDPGCVLVPTVEAALAQVLDRAGSDSVP